MEKWLQDYTPIMDVENDCILSKQGDISIVFKITLPEIFTQSDEDYEALHQGLLKAIKVLPKDSIFHKQDWYIQSKYRPQTLKGETSFLARSSEAYFYERPYLKHDCYIILTKKSSDRKPSSSMFSSLLRPKMVPEQTLEPLALQEFEDIAGQFRRILMDCNIKPERLKGESLSSHSHKIGLIERYYTLSDKETSLIVKDIQLKDGLQVGGNYCQLYTLADTEDLPALCGSRINYDKYSTDKTKFPIGFTSTLGLLLP